MFYLAFETRLHGPVHALPRRTPYVDVAVDASRVQRGGRWTRRPTCARSTSSRTSSSSPSGPVTRSRWRFPTQILCRPDCAGLCPVCGKDLNDEPHEHEETVADPRWAALEALRDE